MSQQRDARLEPGSFDPERLSGVGRVGTELPVVLEMLMDSAEPVQAGPAKGQWKLREDVRLRVLGELSSRDDSYVSTCYTLSHQRE